MRKETSSLLGFSNLPVERLVRDAESVVRWNPNLAIAWMSEAKNKALSPIQIRTYNQSANSINAFLDSLTKMRYYSEVEFWEAEKPARVEILEEILNMDQYLALQSHV